MGELLDLLVDPIPGRRTRREAGPRARRLERLGDGAMQKTSARGEQAAIRDVADSIVSEVQVIPDGLEHMVANHLVDRFRRRGFASAMLRRALEEARAAGLRTAFLQASPDGVGVYRRQGFAEFGTITEYKLP